MNSLSFYLSEKVFISFSILQGCFIGCRVLRSVVCSFKILYISFHPLFCRVVSNEMSQFSHSVVSNSLRPHGLQHARLPCSSPTPGACSNSCPSSCDDIQPSHPLSSPSLPVFNLSQHQGLFQWVSSSHQVAKVLGVSASASVLPVNIQEWFPLGLTGWISLQSKRLSRVFSHARVQKHQFFNAQSLWSNSQIHTWLLENP